MTTSLTRYGIDASDRIESVCDQWLEFAHTNDAPELDRAFVVGRTIWDFIAGTETHQVYRCLFDRVRDKQCAVSFPFRCDSPGGRRYMKLSLAPLPDDGIEFRASLLHEESREPVALLDRAAGREMRFIAMCSWCKRVRLPAKEWVEVEVALREMAILTEAPMRKVTHGICDDCTDTFEADHGL